MISDSFDSRYKKIEPLGEGAYGVVYKSIDQETNNIVALKKVRLDNEEDEGIPPTTIREISILKKIKHANVVPLIDVHISPECDKIYLVFEYSDQDLRQYINKMVEQVPTSLYQKIMHQILLGLLFIFINKQCNA